jgi:biopolymer transport protein ExbB
MDVYTTLVQFLQNGGPFMYPIGFVLAIGVAIAAERYLYLTNTARVNRRDFDRLMPMLQQQRLRELGEVTSKSTSAIARIIGDGVTRTGSSRRRQDFEAAMEEQLLEVLPSIERRTPYLATFANIATLLGLLGTIIGLIAAFTAVAHADPAEKANLLSQSISIAMNTTAFGLMVAIPLLLIHSMLQSKTNAIVESLEIAIVKCLNILDRRAEAAAKASAAASAAATPEPRRPPQRPAPTGA